jgi:multicomponent Na+:H+ antiporter subunit D
MAHGHAVERFFGYYLLAYSATLGVALAGNLLTLYLFYELLTLTTYPLVIHEGGLGAARAGRKYMVYSLLGAGAVLTGTFLTYAALGHLDFGCPGAPAPGHLGTAGLLLLIAGFGVKAAIMPMHGWLPSAMVAPTPVSALLHAVAVVKSGVFGIIRVVVSLYGAAAFVDWGLSGPLVIVACVTIVTASVFALRQDELKRRLAYSTISQLGYILLGVFLANPVAWTGALLHLVHHAFLKITLFFCAGIIITVTGRTRISELAGVGRRLPWTLAAFGVAAMGMVGVLPTNGFIGKWHLLLDALRGGQPLVVVVLVLSALLNAAYFLPIVVAGFFARGEFEPPRGREALPSMLYPVLALALICLVLGTWPAPVLALVTAALGGGRG